MKWQRTSILVVLLFASCVFYLGCGGHGGAASNGDASGTISFRIDWPEPSRLIPIAANSISVEIAVEGKVVAERVIPKPPEGQSSTETTLSNLPPVMVQFTATAYPNTDGTGVAQASGGTTLQLQPNKTVQSTVTMASTITSVGISPTPVNLTVGQNTPVSVEARDSQDRLVLVSSNSVTWSSSDSSKVSILGLANSPNAVATGVAQGNATIQVNEAESGKSASATANVSIQTISVTVSPSSATVPPGGQQQFTAEVTGTSNTAVTWTIVEGPSAGTISADGLYTAPLMSASVATIRAASVESTSATDVATVTLLPSFIPLPENVGPYSYSTITAISADGNVCFGHVEHVPASYSDGIMLDSSGSWTIISSPRDSIRFYASSSTGSVAVGKSERFFGGVSPAFRWTLNSGVEEFPLLGYNSNSLNGIAENDQTYSGNSGGYAVRFSGSSVERLSVPPNTLYSFTNAISKDGSRICGAWGFSSTSTACYWNGLAPAVSIPNQFGEPHASGLDISSDGSSIVGYTSDFGNTKHRAFIWRIDGAVTEILGLGDPITEAIACTADGSVVIGNSAEAFIWTQEGGTKILKQWLVDTHSMGSALNGWHIRVSDISDDGKTIVGSCSFMGGRYRGYMLKLP
ncbi:MAG TPA: Ig-like domain-containing protein [Fimbriimonadaceae bacterium]|nr:Ig-like domain-containing protein [Fimbriimonadaceae bacterium]